MHILGTAGHVDHGKSSLVRALTNIDPDRLKEEKAREMTIDLGFAWLTLPNGEPVGIIDVPGHRDFIENMLAGVGGIDAVIFVVAADEGVMPQTREHLAIVDLLQIPTGLIALTKTDLVTDPDWIDLVQLDLADVTSHTVLANAPMIPVSVRTGQGLDDLQQSILTMLAAQSTRRDIGHPRLWIDRVFSISGFGTVVTGTLLDGQLQLGQEVQLQPTGQRGRVRGLQSHHQTLEVAYPGSRVAVNLAGVEKKDARRGHLLTLPDSIPSVTVVSVRFRHLAEATHPLRHNAEVKFFSGSAETIATVRLLDTDLLLPGAEGWLQLVLRDPLPLIKGDRFILRQPSPGETIGGGQIVDLTARRWRRNRPEVIERLEILARDDPTELILQALESYGKPITIRELANRLKLDDQIILDALQHNAEKAILLNAPYWIASSALASLLERLTHILEGFHRAEPLRLGIRLENLSSQLSLDKPALEALISTAIEKNIVIQTTNGTISRPDHAIRLNKTQRATVDRLLAMFAASPYTPPSYKDAAALVGADVLTALIESGELYQLSSDVLLRPDVFREFMDEARQQLSDTQQVTVKSIRDRFNTSRKYALAVLEYLDAKGITALQGDIHVLASGDWTQL